MYRSLVVPLDGSAYGEQALPYALSIARRAGAAVHLVHVHVPYAFMSADSVTPWSYQWDTEIRDRQRIYLEGMCQRLSAASSVPVAAKLVEGPLIAETLQHHATGAGADLIVMTTHGRGPLSRFWLGSVADELLRLATAPVLLVRPQETPVDVAADVCFRRVLVPLDGSTLSEQVLEAALALGSLTQAEYTLLHVYGLTSDPALDPMNYPLVAGAEPALERMRADTEAYLAKVAERLTGRGFRVQTQVAQGRHAASAILDGAQGVDLIALETHGRRGLPRLLLGSVADKVIRGASIPVLVHHSPPTK
jgi:nucleotide-binding universal stress UspA family protein